VTSISPTTVVAGSAQLTLTVNGTGFLSTTTVQVGGIPDVSTYISPTQVTATVSASQIASGGNLSVIALNGTQSSGSGPAVNLEVTNPVPAITQVSPASVSASATNPTISVTGTGFVPTTVINVNGSARTTVFVSGTQVNTTLTAADLAAPGSLTLTAVNPTPGGGTSTAATVAVNNPAPGGPLKVSPNLVLAGTATPTTITVTGTGFLPTTAIQVAGAARATTYLSATQVTFQLTAADEATSQVLTFSVVNPSPGGGSILGQVDILSQTPTPVLMSLSPSQFYTGAAASTITVNGSNLFSQLNSGLIPLNATSLLWNGTALTITGFSNNFAFGNSAPQSIIAQVPASLLAAAGTATITVNSATATPAVSNALTVTISTAPVPVLTSISPNTGVINQTINVTLTGTGFTPSSVAAVNGTNISSQFEGPTQLAATIPASSITTPGVVNVTVTTPAPGGGTSAALPFTATNPPPPTLTSLYPNAGPINTGAAISLTGTGFIASSTVAINGEPVSCTVAGSTSITCQVPASSLALPGNANFTVTTPPPGGGTSAPQAFTTYLAIANHDIVYNANDGLLYASLPVSSDGSGGNSVAGIDPITGNIVRQIFVGSNPNKLALSTDGTQIFVGLDGAGAVAQVDLNKGAVVNQFSLGGGPGVYNPPYTAAYLAAVPGEPNSVAVAANGSFLGGSGVTIYDSGGARGNSSSGVGDGPLTFGSSSSILYMVNGSTIEQLTVGSTGISAATALANSDGAQVISIQYDNGQLYLSTGQVFNASTGALLGTFYSSANSPANGPIVSDSVLGEAFVGESTFNSGAQLLAFNETNFNSTGSIPVNGVGMQGYPTSFQKIVRWGQNGLALSAAFSAFSSVNQIFIFQSPLVKDLSASPADLAVTLNAPATANTGATVSWIAKITNNGPNQAQGTALSMNLDSSLIIKSVTTSQGTCGTGTEFVCDLGSLANGSSATVTVSAMPSIAGTLAGVATVSSASDDPAITNNQATTSTLVTGNAYSAVPSLSAISPNFVQAGTTDFTLTVTGTGFNEASIVNLGSTALATTYVSATQLTAAVTASEIANYGWTPVTISNPAPGGGVSPVMPLTIYAVVNVPASGLLFDPWSQQLYATIPGTSTSVTGNSIVTVNPFTGAVGTPVNVGSNPNVMAETADGNYLYIGLSGSDSLAQFDLRHQSLIATYPLTFTQFGSTTGAAATWLSVMPGNDTTLVIDTSTIGGGTGIFDITGSTGAFRPNSTGIYTGNFPTFANSSEFYTYDNYTSGAEFYRFSVNSQGISLIDGTTLDGIGGLFQIANGLVYGPDGGIINPLTTPPSQIATLPLIDFYLSGINGYGVSVAADPSLQKEFLMMENTAGTWAYGLARYDLTTYTPEAVVDMPASASTIEAGWTMLRFGQDGLALLSSAENYSTNQPVTLVILLHGPFVTPQLLGAGSAASLTSSSSTTITHGAGNTLLTLTGANFEPGVAVTWNGSYRTTTIVSPSQVTVAIPASDLAAAGSGKLIATNPGAAASNSLTVTIN
jgi:hypothetical protein